MKIIEIERGKDVPNNSKWLREYQQKYIPSVGGFAYKTIDVWQVESELSELQKYKLAYEVLKEANDFYCKEDNWQTPESQGFRVDELSLGVKDMIEEIDSRGTNLGGNKAREAAKKADSILKGE